MPDSESYFALNSNPRPMRGASRRLVNNEDQRKTRHLWLKSTLKILVFFFCIAYFVVLAPELMNWLNRPIARVEVHASFENVSKKELEKVMLPFLQKRFFALQLEAVQNAILEMSWVKKASVRRHWPDVISVKLEEQQPVARWSNSYLISIEGEIFAPDKITDFTSMPVLDGSEELAPEVMQQYLALGQLLRPLGLKVKTLKRSDSGSWRFIVGHVEVNIGRDRRMERLQRFVRLYHAELESRWKQVKKVDLRYLNGASVAWGEIATK